MAVMVSAGSPSFGAPFKNRGYGSISCGEYIQNKVSHELAKTWVAGFVTGMNAIRSDEVSDDISVDVMDGADIDAMTLWLDNYCRANPLHKLAQATIVMVEEVERMKQ